MLQNYGAITQAFMGTLFTWGLTAAGAGMVVLFSGTQVRIVSYRNCISRTRLWFVILTNQLPCMQHEKHVW